MHEVREFAGHADIRTTEVYFVRKEEDAEVAAAHPHSRHGTQGRVSPWHGPSVPVRQIEPLWLNSKEGRPEFRAQIRSRHTGGQRP